MTEPPLIIHATAIAAGGRAALIRGPSGAGKSDLALRCLTLGASDLLGEGVLLVADDQVELRRRGTTIWVSAPAALRSLLEVRGIGIVAVPSIAEAPLGLVADLVSGPVERYPDPVPAEMLLGLTIPVLTLHPFEQSAAAKLILALRAEVSRAC